MSLNRGSLVSLLVMLGILATPIRASDQPRFAICSSNLSDTALGHSAQSARPHLVHVLLNDDGKKQLESFTAEHLGGTVDVVVGDEVLSSLPVHVVVDSGRMQFSFEADSEAEAALASIKSAPPEPCGAQQHR
jgi:hypothetical protein